MGEKEIATFLLENLEFLGKLKYGKLSSFYHCDQISGVAELRSYGVEEFRSSGSTGRFCYKHLPVLPELPNSLTPQLRKSEIFAKVFVRG